MLSGLSPLAQKRKLISFCMLSLLIVALLSRSIQADMKAALRQGGPADFNVWTVG